MKPLSLFVLAGLVWTGSLAQPARADQVYQATGIAGALGDPAYGLRLDGFFGGTANVTFAFTNVQLTETATGATLKGTLTVNRGDPPGNNPTYNLNVALAKVTNTSGIHMYNPNYQYDTIQTTGKELVNTANPQDYAGLTSFPTDGSMPFQVGVGANNKNGNFGAAGWLSWTHHFNEQTYSSCGGGPEEHGDFLMNLTAAPEPSSMALALMGLAGFGLAARRRFWNRSPVAEA